MVDLLEIETGNDYDSLYRLRHKLKTSIKNSTSNLLLSTQKINTYTYIKLRSFYKGTKQEYHDSEMSDTTLRSPVTFIKLCVSEQKSFFLTFLQQNFPYL